MLSRRALLILIVGLLPALPLHAGTYGIEENSGSASLSKAKSSFQASSGTTYYASTKNAQSVSHVNVSVDDTREDNTVEVQEYSEWNTTTTVTVLNNMGGSGRIYTAGDMESKTGLPMEKKGVEEIEEGYSARFYTGGTHMIPNKKTLPVTEEEKPAEKETPSKKPRVLVS